MEPWTSGRLMLVPVMRQPRAEFAGFSLAIGTFLINQKDTTGEASHERPYSASW
jgi:hypothetical protein